RQRRAIGRMRVHDRGHVSPMTVNPQVEAVRWIHHTIAFDEIEIVVDEHDVAGARLIEAETKAKHPVGAWPITAGGDLAGECGLVAISGKNPTGQRYFLA